MEAGDSLNFAFEGTRRTPWLLLNQIILSCAKYQIFATFPKSYQGFSVTHILSLRPRRRPLQVISGFKRTFYWMAYIRFNQLINIDIYSYVNWLNCINLLDTWLLHTPLGPKVQILSEKGKYHLEQIKGLIWWSERGKGESTFILQTNSTFKPWSV